MQHAAVNGTLVKARLGPSPSQDSNHMRADAECGEPAKASPYV